MLFDFQKIKDKTFFDEALNHCSKKSERERGEFFTETKSLRLILSSQWYVKEEQKKDLEFVNWCFQLGLRFNFDFSREVGRGEEEEKKINIVEPGEVEGTSGKVIKVEEYNFRNFNFSQIREEIMKVDPKEHPEFRV